MTPPLEVKSIEQMSLYSEGVHTIATHHIGSRVAIFRALGFGPRHIRRMMTEHIRTRYHQQTRAVGPWRAEWVAAVCARVLDELVPPPQETNP